MEGQVDVSIPKATWTRADLTADEQKALDEMRTTDPELTKPFDDFFLCLFMFARKRDVKRALELLRNHLDWRKQFELDRLDLGRIKAILMSGVFQFAPFNIRVPPGGCGVTILHPSKVPDVMITDVKVSWIFFFFLRLCLNFSFFSLQS